MSRLVDQIVRDTIGNQVIEIIRLTADLEATQERLGVYESQQKEAEKATNQGQNPE